MQGEIEEETRTEKRWRDKVKTDGRMREDLYSVQVYFVVQIIQNMFQNESYTLITACKSESHFH